MTLKTLSVLALAALLCGGCRSVTVNPPPGCTTLTVIVNQSAQPSFDLSALTGLDTNAWKAIGTGAATAAKLP